jgi:hypothetical protein
MIVKKRRVILRNSECLHPYLPHFDLISCHILIKQFRQNELVKIDKKELEAEPENSENKDNEHKEEEEPTSNESKIH